MAIKDKSKIRIGKYMPYFYAGASLDFNLIHIDREFAQANGLTDIILQGMCTMGLTAKHIIENDHPSKMKTFKVRFLHPVLPGDELNFESEINDAEIDVEVTNQNGNRVLRGKATIR
jgi:acyl dehydratase|tara:strand:+ start:363 stop:713 length:351 start_codon:yes stop_codon:yes gene_type:complete